jgi:hypothetical protein
VHFRCRTAQVVREFHQVCRREITQTHPHRLRQCQELSGRLSDDYVD